MAFSPFTVSITRSTIKLIKKWIEKIFTFELFRNVENLHRCIRSSDIYSHRFSHQTCFKCDLLCITKHLFVLSQMRFFDWSFLQIVVCSFLFLHRLCRNIVEKKIKRTNKRNIFFSQIESKNNRKKIYFRFVQNSVVLQRWFIINGQCWAIVHRDYYWIIIWISALKQIWSIFKIWVFFFSFLSN